MRLTQPYPVCQPLCPAVFAAAGAHGKQPPQLGRLLTSRPSCLAATLLQACLQQEMCRIRSTGRPSPRQAQVRGYSAGGPACQLERGRGQFACGVLAEPTMCCH